MDQLACMVVMYSAELDFARPKFGVFKKFKAEINSFLGLSMTFLNINVSFCCSTLPYGSHPLNVDVSIQRHMTPNKKWHEIWMRTWHPGAQKLQGHNIKKSKL